MYALKSIQRAGASRPTKKMVAVFENLNTGRDKKVYFGAKGMSDYTIHKDPERKERYLRRHRARENWNEPMTPGALSRWILWNKPTLEASINDYVKRFFISSNGHL